MNEEIVNIPKAKLVEVLEHLQAARKALRGEADEC